MKLLKKSKEKDFDGMLKRDYYFQKAPMWKSILVSSIPSVLMMLFFGAYSFADSILSVNLANDSYDNDIWAQIFGPKNFVRMAMTSTSPMNILIMSVSLFLSVGISTRTSINLGAKRNEAAINVLKTGFLMSAIIGAILMIILYLVSSNWAESQYPTSEFGTVPQEGFKYLKIFILSVPFIIFANVFASLFVLENRSKEMLIAMVVPIFINLLLDWVFMGPMGMGIEGGALATVVSQAISVIMFIIMILIKRSEILKFKYFFGNMKLVTTFAIFLIGVATFFRYFSLSLMQTTEFNIIKNISYDIHKQDVREDVINAINNYINGKPGQISEDFRIINGAYYKIAEKFKIPLDLNNLGIHADFKLISPKIDASSMTSINENVQRFLKMKISNFKNIEIVSHIIPSLQKSHILNIDQVLKNYSNGTFADILKDNLIKIKASTHMSVYASGAFPVLLLLFPSLFGFIQGSVPIVSYNYGAKNIDRVKKAYVWNIIYSLIITILIYAIGAFALVNPLLEILGVSPKYMDKSRKIIWILISTIPLLSIGISGMIVLQASDFVFLSTIASSLQGIITFYPIQYSMQTIALNNTNVWWLYFMGNPIGALVSSVIIVFIVMYAFKRIKKYGPITLDQRIKKIQKIYDLRKRKMRKTIKEDFDK